MKTCCFVAFIAAVYSQAGRNAGTMRAVVARMTTLTTSRAAMWVGGRAVALVGAGAALGLVVNAVHPNGVRFATFSPPVACTQHEGAGGGPGAGASVALLSPSEVASLCADPSALVADARPAARFAEGHVVGAIHLPCTSSQGAASAALDLLAARKTLVVYGDGTEDALPVAEEMRRRELRPDVRIAVLVGGFQAWSRAGLACASGPCASCEAHPGP
jgi:rhodanese-related sulfurtransferase